MRLAPEILIALILVTLLLALTRGDMKRLEARITQLETAAHAQALINASRVPLKGEEP